MGAQTKDAAPDAGLRSPLPCDRLPVARRDDRVGQLAGVRVLDITTSVAGPYATMLLGDFGADVIKVERPDGDDARQWGPPFLDGQALWFTAVNRNKKSVVLDINAPQDRHALEALIATADVFVTNQPPDVQRKLRLDDASVRALRADIVFVSITGFGLTGARAEHTCYDLIAEGHSGVMSVTGAADGAPQKVGAPAADMLAGQDAAMAAIAALAGRMRTGQGATIDVSLVESMTRFLACRFSSYLGSGETPVRSGGTDSVIAIYQAFDAADEPLTLGLGSDAIWTRFWNVVGDPGYGARADFASNAKRRARRAEIVAHIQSILKTRPRAYWLETLARARVPAGPINRIDQTAHDVALQERGLFYAMEDGEGRLVPQIGLGLHIDGRPTFARLPPPRLGQHTHEVLSQLKRS